MRLLNRTLARFNKLKKTDYLNLFLLCLMTFIGAVAYSCLDIGVINVFLKNQGMLSIGFDYLWVALVMMGVGHYALILDRRKGYGSVLCLIVYSVILWGLLSGIKTDYQEVAANLLFIYKYGFLFLISHAIWSLNARFIRLDFGSLRFLGIFAFEFLGCIGGGLIGLYFLYNPIVLLWGGFLATIAFIITQKIVSDLCPIPKETFVPKTGGVQDSFEQKLVDCILGLSFICVIIRFLVDVAVYKTLSVESVEMISILSWLWLSYGVSGILLMGFMWCIKPFVSCTIKLGIYGLCLVIMVTALGWYFNETLWIYVGAVGVMLCYHLYFQRYIVTLPGVLLSGVGLRIKNIRFLLIDPVAIIFVGALLITTSEEIWVLSLGCFGLGLILLSLLSNHIYSRLLMKMCYFKQWHSGQLMLMYRPLLEVIRQGVDQSSDTAIYFLKILDSGHHSSYKHYLIQALHHESEKVRLFALNELAYMGLKKSELKIIENVFHTDEDKWVQNEALHVLILNAVDDNDKKTYEKYAPYLDNKFLQYGACCGLLNTYTGFEGVEQLVMDWAGSTNKEKNKMALQVMIQYPRREWEGWIENFLFNGTKDLKILALQAAGSLKHPKLLLGVLNALDDLELREAALAALKQYDLYVLPSIEKMIFDTNCPFERRKILVLFLEQQTSGHAKQVLLRSLFVPDPKLRMVVVNSVMFSKMIWVNKDRHKVLRNSIQKDVAQWQALIEAKKIVSTYQHKKIQPILDLVLRGIQEQIGLVRKLVIYQISLLNSHELVQRSVKSLLSKNVDTYAGAASCIQDLLPKEIYKLTKNILINNQEDVNTERLSIQLRLSMDQYLSRWALNPPDWINAWIRVLALQAICRIKSKYALDAVKSALRSSNWLVVDVAIKELWDIAPKEVAQELTLTVPTQYLVQHQFQELLEE